MAINPSPALLAAQEKLLLLRQQAQSQHPSLLGEKSAPNQVITTWPAHLGWYSEILGQALRRQTKPEKEPAAPVYFAPSCLPAPPPFTPSPTPANLALYPDLALTLLQQNRVAESRVWFLLRHLDTAGQGWLTTTAVKQFLGEKSSPWGICGWRQLRILLAQGEGLFWQRQGERLWLRSMVKVAAALGLTHLSGHPVTLPLHLLTRPIGEVKAHFYASFHSGRNHDHQPIARATLTQLSGLSPQTQRHYEKRAGVRPQTNYALGEIAAPEHQEERAWQQGNGTFIFTDFNGQQGSAGTRYLAWQLPNDYTGPHQRQPKGRQKRINRRLVDLRQQGTAGNGQYHKRFFADGCGAIKGQKGREVVWRGRKQRYGGQIWYLLAKSGERRETNRLAEES